MAATRTTFVHPATHTNFPGPGAYSTVPYNLIRAKSLSATLLGPRGYSVEKHFGSDPGYNSPIDLEVIKNRAPGVTIGDKERFEQSKDIFPGPAHYQPEWAHHPKPGTGQMEESQRYYLRAFGKDAPAFTMGGRHTNIL